MSSSANNLTVSPVLLWLLCALTPIGLFVTQGVRTDTVGAGVLYLTGSILLPLARRRDPGYRKVRRFAALKAAPASAMALLVALQISIFFLPGQDVFLILIAAGTAFFAIWMLSSSGDSMARVTHRLLLTGGALLALFLAAEAVFRLPPVVARTGGLEQDRSRWERENYDFSWKENIFNARSLHIETPRQAEVPRILVLGDSFSWGQGIPRTEDTWPALLEGLYRRRGETVQVLNLAQRGYTAVNEIEALERIGWRLEPDIVVLQLTPNDALPGGPNFEAKFGEWVVPTRSLSPLRHYHLVGTSYVYAYLDGRFRRLQERLFHPDGLLPLYSRDSAGWQAMRAAFESLADQSHQRGVSGLVVLFPFFHDLAPGRYVYETVHRQIAEAARSAGLPVVDLWPHYAEIDPDGRSWWALPWDSHPGPEAHALAAEVVIAHLRSGGG